MYIFIMYMNIYICSYNSRKAHVGHIYMCVYVYTYTYINMYTHTHTYIYTDIYTCICMYEYILTHTYTHIYTHTYRVHVGHGAGPRSGNLPRRHSRGPCDSLGWLWHSLHRTIHGDTTGTKPNTHIYIYGAPVTHWDGYDTHCAERYMWTPLVQRLLCAQVENSRYSTYYDIFSTE